MKRVLLNLRDEDVANADRVAEQLGVSRSEVVRRALTRLTAGTATQEDEAVRRARARETAADMEAFGRILARDRNWRPMEIIRAWREKGRRF